MSNLVQFVDFVLLKH